MYFLLPLFPSALPFFFPSAPASFRRSSPGPVVLSFPRLRVPLFASLFCCPSSCLLAFCASPPCCRFRPGRLLSLSFFVACLLLFVVVCLLFVGVCLFACLLFACLFVFACLFW